MVDHRILLAVLGSSAALLAGCSGSPGDPGDTVPPGTVSVDSTTTPEDVVRSYLGALQHDDESAAQSLTTEPYASRDDWATDPPRIEGVEVFAATEAPLTGNEAEGHAAAVSVQVAFDLYGADVSMPDGQTSWGYLLVRDSGAERWLIADAGRG